MKTKDLRNLATLALVLTLIAIANIGSIFHFLNIGFVFEALIGAILLGILISAMLIAIGGKIKSFKEKGFIFFFLYSVGIGLILGGLVTIVNSSIMSEIINFVTPFFVSVFIGTVLGILFEIDKK